MAEPYMFGKIINIIQIQGKSGRTHIFHLLILFTSLTFFNRCFHGISRVREEKIRFQVTEEFTSDIFQKITALPMHRHNDNHSGKTIDKVSKASNALKEFAGMNFMYISTLVFFFGGFVSLALIWLPAAVIIFILSCITLITVQYFDKRLVRLIMEKNQKEHTVMSSLFDFLSNIKTIITLRFEHRTHATIRERVRSIFPVAQRYAILNERKRFSMDMLMAVSVLAILGFYLHHTFLSTGTVLIGTLTMLRQYIEKMRSAFENFTWQWNEIMQLSTNLHTIDDIQDAYDALGKKTERNLGISKQPISIRELSFTYQDTHHKKQVLQNIHIDLIPGKRIALVGASGSGKSTLMMLLRGLYPVDKVHLTAGSQQFDSLEILSHTASLIPQEPEIFEQTIRYNITMGLDVDDATINKYLQLACFDEVVATLPSGLDTDIKEKGVNLSGGQKQRLALARGLLMAAESELLLLDESTSSVDITNETRIYKQIFAHHPEQCIVASIHKLHLLPYFDYVYILDQGHIVEEGSFDLLTQDATSHLSKLRVHYQKTHHETFSLSTI